jgi:hypothetical protein
VADRESGGGVTGHRWLGFWYLALLAGIVAFFGLPVVASAATPPDLAPQAPSTLCVQAGSVTVAAPCSTAKSYATLQLAISAASSGDTIEIAQGTYTDSGVVATIGIPLTLTGGFPGGTTGWGSSPTGSANTTVINGQGSFGVSITGATSVTIQNLAVEDGGIQNNAGTVNVTSNSLILESTGTTNGTFTISSGATSNSRPGHKPWPTERPSTAPAKSWSTEETSRLALGRRIR